MSGWKQVIAKKIPQEENGSDCGMFTCKFAEYCSRRARFTFSQSNMPYFRKMMVWEIVKNKLLSPSVPQPDGKVQDISKGVDMEPKTLEIEHF